MGSVLCLWREGSFKAVQYLSRNGKQGQERLHVGVNVCEREGCMTVYYCSLPVHMSHVSRGK